MTIVAFSVIIASLVALLVVGTEDMGSVHTVFANRSGHVTFTNKGINVQTDTNQDQGCESAGRTSGITNACTATSSTPGGSTTVALHFSTCTFINGRLTGCSQPLPPKDCNNIGCTSVSCPTNNPLGTFNCVTDNGVQLTSCTFVPPGSITNILSCTRTLPGITNSGGVTRDAG